MFITRWQLEQALLRNGFVLDIERPTTTSKQISRAPIRELESSTYVSSLILHRQCRPLLWAVRVKVQCRIIQSGLCNTQHMFLLFVGALRTDDSESESFFFPSFTGGFISSSGLVPSFESEASSFLVIFMASRTNGIFQGIFPRWRAGLSTSRIQTPNRSFVVSLLKPVWLQVSFCTMGTDILCDIHCRISCVSWLFFFRGGFLCTIRTDSMILWFLILLIMSIFPCHWIRVGFRVFSSSS